MRKIFVILIILIAAMYYLNAHYLPLHQRQAKILIDNHISSLQINNPDKITYKANIKMYPMEAYLENLNIDSKTANWDNVEFNDAYLNIEKINYNAQSLLWNKNLEIESIGRISFHAVITYEKLADRFSANNEEFVDAEIMYDDGKTFMRGYFSPFQDKLEFDGQFSLTPDGRLKYEVNRIFTVDGLEQRAARVRQMVDDVLEFEISIKIFDRDILFNDMEKLNRGMWVSGEYEGDKILTDKY